MCQHKSYLTDKCFDHIEITEKIFLPNLLVHNKVAASWIIARHQSLAIENLEKNKLLLELCFAHWLNTESKENILILYESMTGRSTSFGYGGMTISFRMSSPIALENYIKTHSYFNQLLFYAFDCLLPEHLETYELFRTNLNFYAKEECWTAR